MRKHAQGMSTRLSLCTGFIWNSCAIMVRLGASRFWSANSRDAVSVKMATM